MLPTTVLWAANYLWKPAALGVLDRRGSFICVELRLPGGGANEKKIVADPSSPEPAGRDKKDPNASQLKITMRDRSNDSTNSGKFTHLLENYHMELWAYVDNRPIDFDTTTLTPQLPTLTAAQIETNADAFNDLSTIQIGTYQSDSPDG